MNLIVALLLHGLTPAPAETLAFQATDPQHLTTDVAAEHLTAARFAGLMYDVDPAILLGIAWHESHYTNAITKEPGHRVSCGPMTPVPHRGYCSADELSTIGGYLIGAKHLRMWMDHTRCGGQVRCGLTSYVGGGGLVRVCTRKGRSMNAFRHDACRAAPEMMLRARLVRRALGAS